MFQTAERIVKEQCGPELNVQFLSNAPCGFYKYKYPSEVNGKIGAKVSIRQNKILILYKRILFRTCIQDMCEKE